MNRAITYSPPSQNCRITGTRAAGSTRKTRSPAAEPAFTRVKTSYHHLSEVTLPRGRSQRRLLRLLYSAIQFKAIPGWLTKVRPPFIRRQNSPSAQLRRLNPPDHLLRVALAGIVLERILGDCIFHANANIQSEDQPEKNDVTRGASGGVDGDLRLRIDLADSLDVGHYDLTHRTLIRNVTERMSRTLARQPHQHAPNVRVRHKASFDQKAVGQFDLGINVDSDLGSDAIFPVKFNRRFLPEWRGSGMRIGHFAEATH